MLRGKQNANGSHSKTWEELPNANAADYTAPTISEAEGRAIEQRNLSQVRGLNINNSSIDNPSGNGIIKLKLLTMTYIIYLKMVYCLLDPNIQTQAVGESLRKELRYLNSVGFFSEMELTAHNNGSIKDSIVENVDYDKGKVVEYLRSFKHFSSCPKAAIDCMTGKEISPSFRIYKDGDYCWADFLAYHIEKYNIKLPQGFIDQIYKYTAQ